MDKKQDLSLICEMAELGHCSKVVYFENRKRKDLYMWLANVPRGPSAKFLVRNVHTMAELRMTGNCLKGSRPLLSFDETFDSSPQMQLVRELLTQVRSSHACTLRETVATFVISDICHATVLSEVQAVHRPRLNVFHHHRPAHLDAQLSNR